MMNIGKIEREARRARRRAASDRGLFVCGSGKTYGWTPSLLWTITGPEGTVEVHSFLGAWGACDVEIAAHLVEFRKFHSAREAFAWARERVASKPQA